GGSDSKLVVIFARLKDPIVYTLEKQEKVSLVFMVATGSNERDYLEVLRLIALNVSNARVFGHLMSSNDVHEVHHVLTEVRNVQRNPKRAS
ncbi:MAG: PTS sugar transporter subunit IIA, partial [Bacteroidota bacterium]